ncbi:hypothetical protein [Streptomyces sp. S465]|uniref:hypothetical protein n=1 Tax=Streptomyces sp. S465 TaxID=2979468 RepID=UPI0022A8B432|nr:hypothetical protein [Streptomyces sp. S465]WAP60402.1 hypothetical protein N6H00_38560 [Streptomyces sp. S465]
MRGPREATKRRDTVHGLITPEAEFETYETSPERERLTGIYRANGRVCAILGWNAPRQVLRLRRELLTGPEPTAARPAAVPKPA